MVQICTAFVLMAASLYAQNAPEAMSFEVASVRYSAGNAQGVRFEMTPDDGLRATGVTLRFLLQKAYDIEDFQIAGGSGWMRSERFDVFAKPAADESLPGSEEVRAERFRQRLRVLLADRFGLSVREETKEGATYTLKQTKTGHKLKGATGTNGIGRNRGLITADDATMAMLAKSLSVALQRPVIDETGLPGKYAFRLQWAEEGAPGEPEDSGVSLFTAIQEQLGLRLESGKGPSPFIQVDGAERPSAN